VSTRTMLRWIDDWKAEHKPEWTLAREGMKAFRERVNRTVLRDWSHTQVGDAWVSDGHTIEVMLEDPRDGKAKKFELIAWFDAASRMPVGMHINLTENTEAIQLSFRNACLYSGHKPLCVYIDNGKAYKSKYFSGSAKTADDIEIELQGVYGRMGIETIHSMKYNAKAKIIERWWLSLQNQVERITAAWTGRNATSKPANMARDEKFIKAKFAHKALTVAQFKAVVEEWALEIYGALPHPEQKEKSRLQVFLEGREQVPQARRISPDELNWLLLTIEKKRVTNQGITISKAIYWHEAMVRLVGRDVIVRTDYWDVRSILVYDERDRFVCQAPLRTLTDPLVKLKGDDHSRRTLERDIAEVRSVERQIKSSTDQILRRVADATTGMYEALPEETRTAMLESAALIPELRPIQTQEEILAELHKDDVSTNYTNAHELDKTEGQRDREDPEDEQARELAEILGITKKKR
jgi:putative transposase